MLQKPIGFGAKAGTFLHKHAPYLAIIKIKKHPKWVSLRPFFSHKLLYVNKNLVWNSLFSLGYSTALSCLKDEERQCPYQIVYYGK